MFDFWRRARFHLAALALLVLGGCYHFTFEQRPVAPTSRLITYVERRPTYLNGFIGNGKVYTNRYCSAPVRTELRVTATDVLLSVVTLLIYTPHTLYVTCEVFQAAKARRDATQTAP